MNRWHFDQKIDLSHPTGIMGWPNMLMYEGDHEAHEWRVEVLDGGNPVDMETYSITAYFDRSDGKTVAVSGTSDGNTVCVLLPQSVYAAPGTLLGVLRAGKSGSTMTLAVGRWTVWRGPGEEYIDPGHVVPSLPELLDRIAEMEVAKDAANQAAEGATTAAQAADEAREGIQKDLTSIKEDLADYKKGINHIAFDVIENEYVDHSGNTVAYNGWGRTDFIFIEKGKSITINVTVASHYNSIYDSDKVFKYYFATEIGDTVITASVRDIYIMLSNTMAGISSTKITEKVSVINDEEASETHTYSSSRIEERLSTLNEPDIKVVMPTTLVALVDEEFDVYYDNIICNYNADLIPYKETFGGATYGMKDFGRNLVKTAQNTNSSFNFCKYVPNSMYSANLPESVTKFSFVFKTISRDSGSGLNRKVLLIGDSWTAPGLYARELRNLFADENEPMDITLLGTLGNGGAEVGAADGYHEGHGGWSSKTYCTMETYNDYTSHFYNPESQTFDFAYYMDYCGYTSVDDVFINLGINDVATMESFDEIIGYYNTMIDSIRAYDSNIKIFIGLCGLPAEYDYYSYHDNGQRTKARRLLFHERLMQEYRNKEEQGFFIVPLHLSIDSKHDFKTEKRARSFRDSTLVDYCADNVHPSAIAYNKVADRIRTYIKYAETI